MSNFKAIWCFLFLLSLLTYGELKAQSSAQLQIKEKNLKQKIDVTKKLITDARNSQNATLSELKILNKQISFRQELLNNINSQINQLEKDIFEEKSELERLNNNLEELKKEYATMIQYAYKNRNTDYKLMYVFSASSFSQATKRMKYIQQYTEYRKRQVELIKTTQEQIETKVVKLETAKNAQLQLASEQSSEKKSIESDLKNQKSTLEKLKGDESSLVAKLNNQEKERIEIKAQIKKAIQREIEARNKKKNNTTNTTTTSSKGFSESPEVKLASKQFAGNKGRLPWPVEKGTITGHYGKHPHPIVTSTIIENNGIDISTEKGASVRAIFQGKVTSILVIPGAGKSVIISHGSFRTVYTNLADVYVSADQEVDTKEKIGKLLPSEGGVSEAHIEIWKISESGLGTENPANWLSN